jgi:hypothetical protein
MSPGRCESNPSVHISRYVTHQIGPTQQQADSLIDLLERRFCYGTSGNENNVPPSNDLAFFSSLSYRFAHPPFDLIPFHSLSNPPPDDEAKAAVLQAVRERRQDQQGMGPGSPLPADTLKVGTGSQAILLAHHVTGPRPVAIGQEAISVTPSSGGAPSVAVLLGLGALL